MRAYLVHHAEAVSPAIDPQRPLSTAGQEHAVKLADALAARGVAPPLIWHSGKLRARQTAEAIYRACSPFAEFKMVRGLAPDDAPGIVRTALQRESRDVLLAGHMPHLPALTALLTGRPHAPFPLHGALALETTDEGVTWIELWRIGATTTA